jgi:hypothetical protein
MRGLQVRFPFAFTDLFFAPDLALEIALRHSGA